jgi:Glycosyltransferase family 28 C-terminal domain
LDRRQRVDLIYIESGGGHKASAIALEEVIRRQKRPWDVRLRSAQELLGSIDVFRKLTGIPFQEIYNIMLRRGWTLGTSQMIPAMHLCFRPDIVVSLIPNFNRAMQEAIQIACPGTPLVTVLTDFADFPPHFWMERQLQYIACGTARAVEQARQLGHSDSHILRTSGMVLHPRFYDHPEIDLAAERARLGLKPNLPTGLVLFGGEGSMEIVRIVRALNESTVALQLIVLCGRQQKAADAIHSMTRRIPVFVEGFTKEVPHYMRLADFFIGKPGPGCISEALAMGLPVIVERNAWTLAQERYNTQWIVEQQVGIVVNDFGRVSEAVHRLLAAATFDRFRSNVAKVKNFAVFEVPSLLEAILEQHAMGEEITTRRQVIHTPPHFSTQNGEPIY